METSAASSRPPGSRATRTAGLYLMLVGLPALGVAATLQAGRSLVAPPAVGGAWRVAPAAGGCERAGGTLTVSQSGQRLTADYAPDGRPAVALRGRLDGERLDLTGPTEGCERVQASVGGDALQATVQTGACGCRPTEASLARDTSATDAL